MYMVAQQIPRTFFLFLFLLCCGTWDLTSQTRDQTEPHAVEAKSLSHWTAKDVSLELFHPTNLSSTPTD